MWELSIVVSFTPITILALVSLTFAQPPITTGYKGKVRIVPPVGSFQLCFDGNCKNFNETVQKLEYNLPIAPHNNQVNVALVSQDDNGVQL